MSGRSSRPQLGVDDYVAGVRSGDRALLARTITLVESNNAAHRRLADAVLERLLPFAGGARRVGITGVPGAGKSTLIDELGSRLIERGHQVAVLAVDPSSTVRGGSILGDKTRMQRLSTHPQAFVRPSPTGGTLGGVHRKTRETLLVCEAAGYDVVLVESVGVGQSEVALAGLVDTLVLLLIAGAGDELQGIKRGILEHAHLVAITKADGEGLPRAERARRDLAGALRLMNTGSHWMPRVLTCSAQTGEGIDALWAQVEAHRAHLIAEGALEMRRREQRRRWLWEIVEQELVARHRAHPGVRAIAARHEARVAAGDETAGVAAAALLEAFGIEP